MQICVKCNCSQGLDQKKEPSSERLQVVFNQLLALGNAQGRMQAAHASQQEIPDSEFVQNMQFVFNQTLLEYFKVWNFLSERNDKGEIKKLWSHHLQDCQNYLTSSIPSNEEQLIEDLALSKVYDNILGEQYTSLSSSIEKSPVEFESLVSLHTTLEEELQKRRDAMNERLELWKRFRKSQETLSSWLKHMEKEKRALDLPFLQLKRVNVTKRNIEGLIQSVPLGEQFLADFKTDKASLLPYCSPDLKSTLQQEFGAQSAQLDNLQAALKTWLSRIVHLEKMNEFLEQKSDSVFGSIDEIDGKLVDLGTPTTFADLDKYVENVDVCPKSVFTFML